MSWQNDWPSPTAASLAPLSNPDFRRTSTKNRRGTFGPGAFQKARTASSILEYLSSLERVKMANLFSLFFSATYFRCWQEGSLELTTPAAITEEALCKNMPCFVLLSSKKTNNKMFTRHGRSCLFPFHGDDFQHK